MKLLKESGYFFLLWFVVMLLGSTFFFFLSVSITPYHFILSFIVAGIIDYFFTRKESHWHFFLKKMVLCILLVSVSILISCLLFDRSSDGNTYHKDAIGVLKEGWNPVYESSKDWIEKREGDDKSLTDYSIWIDHYAKANWIIASNFYAFTGNIESGKAMNFLSIYIVFSILFSFLQTKISWKKAFLLSLAVVFNPITAAQLFTYYNDQLVCLYLFLAVFFLIRIDDNRKDQLSWYGYLLTFILLANIKFNGLGYLLVFSFFFVCRYLYQAYRKKEFFPTFRKLCLFFIPLFIVSFLLAGYTTYVKNTLDHQNPFFPLYDENGEDIITQQQPKGFLKMNSFEKLWIATFSKANNLLENQETTLKIPFTVSKSEIIPAMSNDLRISGWGLFFSGILLLSIFTLIRYYRSYQKESWILYTLFITIFLLIIMSESWWARYTPHFYFFPLFTLYILLCYGKKKWFSTIFIVYLFLNSLIPLLGNSYYTLTQSIKILKDFHALSHQEIIIEEKGMHGILYNLKDYQISYELQENIEGKELYYHYLEYKEK